MSGNNQNSNLKGSLSFAAILSEIDVAANANAVSNLQTQLNNGSLKGDKGDAGDTGPAGALLVLKVHRVLKETGRHR